MEKLLVTLVTVTRSQLRYRLRKMCHYIFDYNNSLIDFDKFCSIGNRNKHSTKHVQTVSLQSNCVFTLYSIV